MKRHASRLAFFALGPMLAAVTSLIGIPAITTHYGDTAWAAIAIGTSVGMGASVLGELGWTLDGPARIARAGHRARQTTFALALSTKLVLLPITTALGATVAWLLAQDHNAESALTAAGFAAAGLTMSWFFIGSGEPQWILLTDGLPRLMLTAGSALIIAGGGPLIVYPIAVCAASVASPALAGARVLGTTRRWLYLHGRQLRRAMQAQLPALSGRAASATYIALPTTLVALVAPGSVAVFAAAERLQRMALALLAAFPNSLFNWVSRDPSPFALRRRVLTAIWMNAGLGVLAVTGWIWLAPLLSHYVFSGTIVLPMGILFASAGVILLTCVSRAVGGIALVSMHAVGSVSASAAIGAAVGIGSILFLGSLFGAVGAMTGEALAEAAVLFWQLRALTRVLPPRRH